jgi:hypothetical protein
MTGSNLSNTTSSNTASASKATEVALRLPSPEQIQKLLKLIKIGWEWLGRLFTGIEISKFIFGSGKASEAINPTSKTFQALDKDGQEAVVVSLEKIAEAVRSKSSDSRSAASAELNKLGDLYDRQAARLEREGRPEMAAQLRSAANDFRTKAIGVANGAIPLDRKLTTASNTNTQSPDVNAASQTTTANKESDGKAVTKTNPANKSLAVPVAIQSYLELGEKASESYQDLIVNTMKSLGLDRLDDRSAKSVAQVLLTIKVDPTIIQQGLAVYYEKVQGLSPTESAEKAKGIVEAAQKDAGSKEAGKPLTPVPTNDGLTI